MSLFDVPGWTVPKDVLPASTSGSKKRKRLGAEAFSADQKLQSAEVNLEKLVKKLGGVTDIQSPAKQKNKKRKKNKITDRHLDHGDEDDASSFSLVSGAGPDSSSTPVTEKLRPNASEGIVEPDDTCLRSPSPTRAAETHTCSSPLLGDEGNLRKPGKKNKGKKKEGRKMSAGSGAHDESQREQTQDANAHLTALQSKMKQSLDGARFRFELVLLCSFSHRINVGAHSCLAYSSTLFIRRWINETLYKSSSQDAERLMREDPKVFEEVREIESSRHDYVSSD